MLDGGGALPGWITLDPATGQLRATHSSAASGETRLRIKFQFTPAISTDYSCTISTSLPHRGAGTPWVKALPAMMDKFSAPNCAISKEIRLLIQERLHKVYDFKTCSPRDVTLKRSLDVLSRCLRMLRSASVANLTAKS